MTRTAGMAMVFVGYATLCPTFYGIGRLGKGAAVPNNNPAMEYAARNNQLSKKS